jgi:cysteine desulfurase NifS
MLKDEFRPVYADNAATTKISKNVLDSMMPYLTEQYGNPSSIYKLGVSSSAAVEAARAQLALAIGCNSDEIYFTSGGSESDNWAIKGIAEMMLKKGKNHIISSKFEHHAVLHTLKALEKKNFKITLLDVNKNGIINPKDLADAINDKTGLVTIMYANNEIGTIQPIAELAEICKANGIFFHTDAVQAAGHIKINVKEDSIDLLSLSAHKFNGPKGVGALYCKKGLRFDNLIEGGAQEKKRRAGTENVPGIVGLGAAITESLNNLDEKNNKLCELRDHFIEEALKIKRSRLNGDQKKRLPGNINMCFEGIEGESLLLMLDNKGITASSGSACTSGSLDPSHVLLSIGLPHEIAHGSLRISINHETTLDDIDYILKCLTPIVERLRYMSPLWEQIINEEKNKGEV